MTTVVTVCSVVRTSRMVWILRSDGLNLTDKQDFGITWMRSVGRAVIPAALW